ncbi:MAG: hypothetical protein EXS11_10665, partial [Gemmataceae bacterium]|nr:hypothetical protein [Gemmataceae bacterium]
MDIPDAGRRTIREKKCIVCVCVFRAGRISWDFALPQAANGASFLITPEIVQAWEKKYRPLGPGDVVLFKSGYSDRYYKPLALGG